MRILAAALLLVTATFASAQSLPINYQLQLQVRANTGGTAHGVFTENVGVLSQDFFRTLLDLGTVLPAALVTMVAEDASLRGLLRIEDLVCILERLGGPGRRGTKALRVAVAEAVPSHELESRLEIAVARLIRAAGGPAPVNQHEIGLVDGSRARLDFAWPDRWLAVEADGRRWHVTKRDFERGLVRSRALEASGWRVYPFGWTDVYHHRTATLAELRRLLASLSEAA